MRILKLMPALSCLFWMMLSSATPATRADLTYQFSTPDDIPALISGTITTDGITGTDIDLTPHVKSFHYTITSTLDLTFDSSDPAVSLSAFDMDVTATSIDLHVFPSPPGGGGRFFLSNNTTGAAAWSVIHLDPLPGLHETEWYASTGIPGYAPLYSIDYATYGADPPYPTHIADLSLTPVPEPSTFAIAGIVSLGMLGYAWWSRAEEKVSAQEKVSGVVYLQQSEAAL